ncbi:MAG: TIGR03118 family protein [Chloroflexi bacterium 13_1_40CM_4_68_4]|nr:MAG: TIGR03118 family protein [Chloroflexi bacterium 13_1_40CM_4_68_4]
MKVSFQVRRVWIAAATLAVTILIAGALVGTTAAAEENAYVVHNLVSDVPGLADHADSHLVNGWGLTALATSPWWVADNGTSVSTLYRADGTQVPLVVDVASAPTGAVSNAKPNFVVHEGTRSGSALFLFDTEEGKILGWNPGVALTRAVVAVDRSGMGAVYKGLAIASTGAGDFLYAADFHNARVDVFDGSFNPVSAAGAFVDPKLSDGFAPFGIQNIGGRIFVAYAKQDATGHDEVDGQGLGFVDMFGTSGELLGRVATRGQLDAPWGLALAPAGFGRFGGDLLVGNFGDGHINAYELQPAGNYEHRGELRGVDGKPIAIDGLWSLQFGHGAPANGPTDTLFFTAGPAGESEGLFGTIRAR